MYGQTFLDSDLGIILQRASPRLFTYMLSYYFFAFWFIKIIYNFAAIGVDRQHSY